MDEAAFKSIIEQAIARLFTRQPDIFAFTSETGQTEWNLAHHLAVELSGFFPGLNYDLDVIKRNYGNMRPDIIFHKRGTHESNYLVIEVKRDGHPTHMAEDVEKIKTHWFMPPLHYSFGATVNLRTDGKHEIQVFKNSTE
jgi:hypothetical protein